MADQQKPWNGNNVFRTEGFQFVPHGSTAARLLAGAYGPDPNQTAPAGFGGLVAKADGSFGTYGSGSQLASLLAGVNQATGGKLGPRPAAGPPSVPAQAAKTQGPGTFDMYALKARTGLLGPLSKQDLAKMASDGLTPQQIAQVRGDANTWWYQNRASNR